jgi:hypothetical protein
MIAERRKEPTVIKKKAYAMAEKRRNERKSISKTKKLEKYKFLLNKKYWWDP